MIPEEIKNKISVKVFEYSKENSPKQVVIPAFHDGAIFGYCLSLTEIEGLKKENERLVALLENLVKGIWGTDPFREDETKDEYWQSFAKANNIKL